MDFPTNGRHSVKGVQSSWEVQQWRARDAPTPLSSSRKPSRSSPFTATPSPRPTARSLGRSEKLIRNWQRTFEAQGEHAFPGPGNLPPFEEENRRLRAENQRLLAERDLLKKAAAFFAREAT